MARHAQIVHRSRAHFVGVLEALEANLGGELRHLLTQVRQRVDELGHLFVHALLGHQLANEFAKLLQGRAVVAQHLAAQQVQALDGVGALVDHVDAVVAHKLFHAPFFDEAVAAKDLHAGIGGDMAVVGNKGFDDGSKQGEQFVAVLAHFLIRMVVGFVQQHRAKNLQGPAPFCIGLGGQQHFAHVGVHDDRVGRFVFGFGAGEAAHLDAVFGVSQRVLVSHLGQAQTLIAHAQAGGVHHHKHALHALVGLAHHGAVCAVQHYLRSRVAVDAHLVLQAAAVNAIARTQ